MENESAFKLSRPEADIYVPDGSSLAVALRRTTHLAVVAHQDDIETMAFGGIVRCYETTDKFFAGVVATNGAGSPRTDRYAAFTDEQMQTVRREEQRRAADIGKYGLVIQLAHPSAHVKAVGRADVARDLASIFGRIRPEVVYLHNPADKHDTHVAVLLRCLEALRALPRNRRPPQVLGCEAWRGLDWLMDSDKVALDAGQRPELGEALLQVFDSQISGGKRYDVATLGRRAANATMLDPHRVDTMSAVTWAMDLTPLVANEFLSVRDYTLAYVERLCANITGRISKLSGGR